MRILLIEPYYTGSHKVWADGYKKYSRNQVELLTLEGRHWKWRMHGAAIEIAAALNCKYKTENVPDLFLVSDMIDLTTLKSLLHKHIAAVPVAFYFHENQLSYPYTENDTDSKRARDFHYGFINYTSALASDRVFFNSKTQMDSFFEALENLLKRMPDYNGIATIQALKDKTSVLPLGIDYSTNHPEQEIQKIKEKISNEHPTVLWTHRWEYDKNPDDFFAALTLLSEQGYAFNLAVLGAKSPKPPRIFKAAKDLLSGHIVAYGKPDTYSEYIAWLHVADILPITSYHETFGISLMEAIHCGVKPLLPNRLSYPELVPCHTHPDLYYKDQDDLIRKLKEYIDSFNKKSPTSPTTSNLQHLSQPYSWEVMHDTYDDILEKLVKTMK